MLGSLVQNTELLRDLVQQDFVGLYKGAMLGAVWSPFSPLLMLAIYTFVFSVAFKATWGGHSDESNIAFAIVLLSGIIVHTFFAECLNRLPSLIVSHANYVKKVVFPLEILSWMALFSAFLHFLVSFGALRVFCALSDTTVHIEARLAPRALTPLILMIIGMSWILTSLGACAAYKHLRINGRMLDLGCGDGRYSRLIWPHATEVVGVDMNPEVAELGRQSGVYCRTHVASSHAVPEPAESFDHILANCPLEHMDHLDAVLGEIARCLKPGGSLLCSVATNRFVDWSVLPAFVHVAGFESTANTLRNEFLGWHQLANPLTVEGWTNSFERVALNPEEHVPFLAKHNGGEVGDVIFPFLSANSNFPAAFRKIVDGLLEMEADWLDCCGAVFLVRKPGHTT